MTNHAVHYASTVTEHDEQVRLYGPWREHSVHESAELMAAYPGVWWVAGGWAIEAFTGRPRAHDDLDISIPRSDVPLLRRHLRGVLDVWAADRGSLTPLTGDPEVALSPTCGNLWLRPSGADPWEYDVILMDVADGIWTYKRDARVSLPIGDILWQRDGITYLRPEVQLLHKSAGLRPKDQADFDACLPLLNGADRAWLASALEAAHPGHPWLRDL
jgi:hypothetical protein